MNQGTSEAVRPDGKGLRIGLVAARFHGEIVERLLDGARAALLECGLAAESIGVERVPGAWEIPFALDEMARTGRWDGLVALGALVRGETSHFELIARVSAEAISEVSRRRALPISFGLLTCETISQATARAGGDKGNLGADAAAAALEMAILARRLRAAATA